MKMARRKVLKMLYEQRMTVEEAEAMLEVLEKPISTPVQPPKIALAGKGEKARALMAKVLEASRTELPVLVEGETGTGKELIARCIHQNSLRSQGPFLTFDSLASPETLDVEIFGQEDGERKGLLDMADGGTLMLDFTHALTPETQHKLHSYLEHGYFTRVDGGRPVYTDVRLVAATSRDLSEMVKEGTFRDDLYGQIRMCYVYSPPLRERLEDLTLLVEHFIGKRASEDGREPPQVSEAVWEKLQAYRWPRNVRQLAQVVQQAVVSCDGIEIEVEHLPDFEEAA